MRATDTFENFIGKVHSMSQDYYDEVIPIRDMEFDSFDNMTIGYKEYEILPSAQRLIANRLRIPQSYLSKMPGGSPSKKSQLLAGKGEQEQGNTLLSIFGQ